MISSKLAGTVDFGPDDFAKFAQTGKNTMIVMVREDCPYPDLKALLNAAAENPKSLKFGANIGSAAYFITLQLEKAVPGAKFSIVSADGGADRYNRLIGGHLDAGIFSLSEYLDFRDGDDTPADRNVKALSVLSEERHPAIPDAGTAIEQGFPVTFSNGYYWWAAKDTPPEIQEYLADVLERTMQTEIAQSEMKRLRIDPTFLRGKEVEADIQATVDSFKSVIAEENRVVPDFAKYMQILVLILFVIVIIVSIRERGQPDEDAIDLDSDSPAFTKRKGRAAACFVALLSYVLLLVFTPIPFAICLESHGFHYRRFDVCLGQKIPPHPFPAGVAHRLRRGICLYQSVHDSASVNSIRPSNGIDQGIETIPIPVFTLRKNKNGPLNFPPGAAIE